MSERKVVYGNEPGAGYNKGASWYEQYYRLGFEKLLNDKGLTAHQVDLMLQHIVFAEFTPMGEKTTVCLLKHVNGFEVIGTSACIDPKDFKWELGVKFALISAIQKLDELVGFELQHSRYKHTQQAEFFAQITDKELGEVPASEE